MCYRRPGESSHASKRAAPAVLTDVLLLLGLVLAAGIAHATGWRFDLEAGKRVPSTLDVVNRCRTVHSFQVSAGPTLSFVTFRDPVEVRSLPPGQKRTVAVEFNAAGLEPRLYQGEIVVRCLDCGTEPGCSQSAEVIGVEMTVVAPKRRQEPGAEPAVFDLTLELFWKLAAVEAEKPGALTALLDARPEEAAALLRRLEVFPAGYDDKIAGMAPVKPRFIFAKNFADLLPRATGLGLNPEASLPNAPPMMLRGRSVSLLVLFQPRTNAGGSTPARQAVPAVFLPRARLSLRPADASTAEPTYTARPSDWTPGIAIDHSLCGDLSRTIEVVTKLTYGGGGTDTEHTDLAHRSQPTTCRGGDGPGIDVRQKTRPQPAPPVIIASAYLFREGYMPSALWSDVVIVPRKGG